MFAVVLPEITFLLSPVYLISQRFVATERETEVVRYRQNFWLFLVQEAFATKELVKKNAYAQAKSPSFFSLRPGPNPLL